MIDVQISLVFCFLAEMDVLMIQKDNKKYETRVRK
jgi:hypothetical protein